MNIYLMDEDNEGFCIKAESMAEAVNICEQSYLEDLEANHRGPEWDLDAEKKYYREEVLQSCSLIGKLKN